MLDYVTRLLFEELPLLLTAELVALTVVLAIHRRRLTPQSRRMVWVTLAVCGLLITIQKLTVTKREAIREMVSALARAVDEGDVPAIAERLDVEFQYSRWNDGDSFLAEVERKLGRWQVDQASVSRFEIGIDAGRAEVSFRGTCDWRSGDQIQYNLLSSWTVECIRRDDGWKLYRITRAKVGPGGMLDLADAWRY